MSKWWVSTASGSLRSTCWQHVGNKGQISLDLIIKSYLIGDWTDFDGYLLGAGHFHDDGMFSYGEAVPDAGRVEQNGVDEVLVHWRSLPVGFTSMEKVLQINIIQPVN